MCVLCVCVCVYAFTAEEKDEEDYARLLDEAHVLAGKVGVCVFVCLSVLSLHACLSVSNLLHP
jgi:hypothetical protein